MHQVLLATPAASLLLPLLAVPLPAVSASAVSASAGLAVPVTADKVVPQFKEGTVISRTILVETEFELLEVSAIQDGEEIPSEMLGDPSRTSFSTVKLECVENVEAAAEGDELAFSRHFVSAGGSFEFDMEVPGEEGLEPISDSGSFTSDAEGETVHVTARSAEDDALEWTVEPGEGSSLEREAAAQMRGDYSFTFLLSEDEVEKGDSWSIDPSKLSQLLDPVGVLPGSEGPEEWGDPGDEEASMEYTGTIEAEHAGSREVDGVELTVIKLTFECEGSDTLQPETDGMGDESVEIVSLEIQVDEVVDGKGELLYDPSQGLIVKLELDLSMERTTAEDISLEIDGVGEIKVHQADVDGGTFRVEVDSSVE